MPVTCSAFNCKSRYGQTPKVSFHRFPFGPRRAHLLSKWIENVRPYAWIPTQYSFLCSKHFLQKDIDRTGQTIRLRDDAVPMKVNFSSAVRKRLKTRKPSSGRIGEVRAVDDDNSVEGNLPHTNENISFAENDNLHDVEGERSVCVKEEKDSEVERPRRILEELLTKDRGDDCKACVAPLYGTTESNGKILSPVERFASGYLPIYNTICIIPKPNEPLGMEFYPSDATVLKFEPDLTNFFLSPCSTYNGTSESVDESCDIQKQEALKREENKNLKMKLTTLKQRLESMAQRSEKCHRELTKNRLQNQQLSAVLKKKDFLIDDLLNAKAKELLRGREEGEYELPSEGFFYSNSNGEIIEVFGRHVCDSADSDSAAIDISADLSIVCVNEKPKDSLAISGLELLSSNTGKASRLTMDSELLFRFSESLENDTSIS